MLGALTGIAGLKQNDFFKALAPRVQGQELCSVMAEEQPTNMADGGTDRGKGTNNTHLEKELDSKNLTLKSVKCAFW